MRCIFSELAKGFLFLAVDDGIFFFLRLRGRESHSCLFVSSCFNCGCFFFYFFIFGLVSGLGRISPPWWKYS